MNQNGLMHGAILVQEGEPTEARHRGDVAGSGETGLSREACFSIVLWQQVLPTASSI